MSLTSLREKARPEQTKILVFIHLRAIPLKIDMSWLSSSGQLLLSCCPVLSGQSCFRYGLITSDLRKWSKQGNVLVSQHCLIA